ncbi:MAG: glycosyltransferase family 4 protein [Gammaproteobacteria bacterium]|nr:glycosyltransferase family 4 protein [Gammaproteobacteria bacterium]
MYDYIILTHLPSFYKINLYNELAKKLNIHVIFLGQSSRIRPDNFTEGRMEFSHEFLYKGAFEARPKLKTCWKLYRRLNKLQFKKIILGGWELPESWLTVLSQKKLKNAFALESSFAESKITGYKAWIKKVFLSRVSMIFCSGSSHEKLVRYLGYSGQVAITQGVGIFNRSSYHAKSQDFTGKFLYIGRFAEEKNLAFLLDVFKGFPQFQLDLVGEGPLKTSLQSLASDNIHFHSYLPNQLLAEIYATHDVFILPSLKEPWGLVVDEALFYGLPAIVSNRVGCYPELVERYQAGLVFDPLDKLSLSEAIVKIADPAIFTKLKANVKAIDFMQRDNEQVQVYVTALK